jgi:formyl-CoA transferase
LQVLGFQKVNPTAAPWLGEHGTGILKDLGFDATEIARLNDAGAVTLFGGSHD